MAPEHGSPPGSCARQLASAGRRVAALAPALSLSVASLAASPAEPGVELANARSEDFLLWHAPVGCSTAAAVRERVSELLGTPELARRHVQRVEGRVTETATGWTLHLTLVGALGRRERQLSSEHCQDLAEAAAVAITLAFEAARASEAAGSGTAEPTATSALEADATSAAAPRASDQNAAPPTAEALGPTAAAPRGAARPAPAATLGAEVLLDEGSLPSVAPGLSLFGALRCAELRLGVYAAWLPDAEEAVRPGQSVSFSLLSGGVRACYALGHGLIDTSLCAGAELGRLSASGAGLFRARSRRDLWLAPHVGLELGAPLGSSLALHLRADAVVPVLRHGYAVNETENVHDIPGLSLRGAAGAAIAF